MRPALLAILLIAQPALAGFDGVWLDLTHSFNRAAIYWPTADSFEKTVVAEGETDKGFYYSAYNFRAAEHGGTHVDAPIHFARGMRSVGQIPLEQLIGPGVVIDIRPQAEENRNYQATVEDIKAWESEHGPLPEGAIVLFNTGSSDLWPDKERYMGTAERGADAVAKLRFPGIHPNAARFLANERNIKAVGLDTPSIDYGGSTLFETHQILFKNNIPGIENVANLNALPAKGFEVIGLPMKIQGGSGAPLRIVAFLPNVR
ncbi:cyclase family protein [Ferrimonas marina]|uniref:Kynurenine formamidase n=1 Tax=Ferrimonas marina TaxID=299255 RepID=A0A1M5RFI7_9GAMM|nr:cyclase family protein [Ferrimonas marina]SHH25031.1 Kynurenine formamidase [Ferrimonas marina]